MFVSNVMNPVRSSVTTSDFLLILSHVKNRARVHGLQHTLWRRGFNGSLRRPWNHTGFVDYKRLMSSQMDSRPFRQAAVDLEQVVPSMVSNQVKQQMNLKMLLYYLNWMLWCSARQKSLCFSLSSQKASIELLFLTFCNRTRDGAALNVPFKTCTGLRYVKFKCLFYTIYEYGCNDRSHNIYHLNEWEWPFDRKSSYN